MDADQKTSGSPEQTSEQPDAALSPNRWNTEDWWAVWIGGFLLAVSFLVVFFARPGDFAVQVAVAEQQGSRVELSSPLRGWIARPQKWVGNPLDSLFKVGDYNYLGSLAAVFLCVLLHCGVGLKAIGQSFGAFARGFVLIFALATLAYVLAAQATVRHYNLEYALWALVVGLSISNTVGTPSLVRGAVRTEFYIKTGLVLLGAEILFSRLLALGRPGIAVAWVVTPIVLVSTYVFGQRLLRIESKSLNMTISADMSVCGVSAAIATAAACKAKKEELSLAIGMSLTFTVIMMVVMPKFIEAVGMGQVLGGAWMGGTIDATGAVAAAGEMLGERALPVAATVKMIQNILIGVIAFAVAVYWVLWVERGSSDARPNAWEVWYRFPKFVIGFVLASLVFSAAYTWLTGGPALVDAVIQGSTKTLRGWFFCLAFVSIGLETNFRELARYLKGGKPLVLYVAGQALNLCLTLLMGWLMFVVVFPDAAASLLE